MKKTGTVVWHTYLIYAWASYKLHETLVFVDEIIVGVQEGDV